MRCVTRLLLHRLILLAGLIGERGVYIGSFVNGKKWIGCSNTGPCKLEGTVQDFFSLLFFRGH